MVAGSSAVGPEDQARQAFQAFCEAGLWPGLGKTLPAVLPDVGINGPNDVTLARLAELPKVSPLRAGRLFSAWIAAGPTYDVVLLLIHAGFPARLAVAAVDSLGDDAAALLREDPWRLLGLTGVSIGDADRFAHATEPGIRREDPRRGRAIVGQVLAVAARDGHTVTTAESVAQTLLTEHVPDPAAAIAAALDAGTVLDVVAEPTDEDDLDATPALELSLARFGMAEQSVAEQVARLVATADTWASDADVDAVADGLDSNQRAAVAHVFTHGLSLLTGGPGTGKSRTVAAVVALAAKQDRKVALAAPTGRAAKRLEELTGVEASTVHRMLGAQGRNAGFLRGESNPIEAAVVVVDETSMLDVELAASLLEACAEGTHVLLVGDPAQLPSIGPGRILADLVDSGAVPVTELTTLYRQAEGGAIARLATAVREGTLPPVDSPDREVVVVPAKGSGEAAHRTVQLVVDSIPRALSIDSSDVQVVTPVHRGPAGTVELNRALKAKLNPGKGTVWGFDPGDRVVATANHLDLSPVGFANGEVGVVKAAGGGEITVEFAAGLAKVSGKALADIKHGWAITVHRAQGSEWPAIVVVLPPESSGMLSRPLVYTALTRAQRHLSIVHAAGPVLARAVHDVGGTPRRTRLCRLLAEELDATADPA